MQRKEWGRFGNNSRGYKEKSKRKKNEREMRIKGRVQVEKMEERVNARECR